MQDDAASFVCAVTAGENEDVHAPRASGWTRSRNPVCAGAYCLPALW